MFEALNMKIGYYHGRFQPFHNGHLEIVKYALSKCELLAIGVSNPFRLPPILENYISENEARNFIEPRLPKNNPFPYWARILMIRNGLIHEQIPIDRIIFLPNLSNTGLPVDEIRFPKSLTKIFTSPKDSHNKIILNNYKNEGWDIEVLPTFESENILNARNIRKKINDGKNWEKYVPIGTALTIQDFFDQNLISSI